MNETAEHRSWTTLYGWLCAAGTVLLIFFWEGKDGFNLWDEGFLWYGAQRVVAGEVPIRDFMAYDPLRYYWSGAWMGLRGDTGIMALREGAVVFQVVGLVAGLAALGRSVTGRAWLWWLLVAMTLGVWMFPRHKVFDASASLLLVWALASWVARPQAKGYLVAGLTVGVVAAFGRNHGIYGLAGSAGVMLYLAGLPDVDWKRGFWYWAGGVVIGYLPVLVMLAGVPGFAASFRDSILFLFDQKATNLPLPVPWPWLISLSQGSWHVTARGLMAGLFFVALLVFGVGGLAWLAWSRTRHRPVAPATVASVCLILPYAHFAFSRADIGHLAQGIFPLLISGLSGLAALRSWMRWTGGLLLLGCSLMLILPEHPGWQRRFYGPWEEKVISGSTLRVAPTVAADLALLDSLARGQDGYDRDFYTAPYWPGAYAVYGRRSPVWEIYALFPRGQAFQEKEIVRLQAAAPSFVVLMDIALDGREELRFARTHVALHRYIRENFEPAPGFTRNPMYQVFVPRVPTP